MTLRNIKVLGEGNRFHTGDKTYRIVVIFENGLKMWLKNDKLYMFPKCFKLLTKIKKFKNKIIYDQA